LVDEFCNWLVYGATAQDVNRALIRSSMCMNPAVGNNVMLFPYGGGEHQQVRFRRYRFSPTGELGYRDQGPVGLRYRFTV
jgi:hypothetical protein